MAGCRPWSAEDCSAAAESELLWQLEHCQGWLLSGGRPSHLLVAPMMKTVFLLFMPSISVSS